MTPDDLIALGRKHGARLVVSSYNEPLITSEWAMQIFRSAHEAGFLTGYVSNGNATPEVLEYIQPHTDLFKIDLKSFQDKNYRSLGCKLVTVTDAIKQVYDMGFWLEIVTLIVPGFNDSRTELQDMAGFIAGISADIPWHVTAFHKDYKMLDPDNTTEEQLIRAAEIGLASGLRYVYAGNMPGRVGDHEHTYCHNCGYRLIRRAGFRILDNRLPNGLCPQCDMAIPGFWN
jgi:pyruvate formate lyase activating enzyme